MTNTKTTLTLELTNAKVGDYLGAIYDDFNEAGLATSELGYFADLWDAISDQMVNADEDVLEEAQVHAYNCFMTEAKRILSAK